MLVRVPLRCAAALLRCCAVQSKKAFEVQWVMGRDLGPTEVADMMQTVEQWCARLRAGGAA